MTSPGAGPRLLHVMTVPQTLCLLIGQTRYMRFNGFTVAAVTAPGPYQKTFATTEGALIFSVPMTRRITPFADLVALVRLVRVIREFGPDVVHAHTPKGGLLGMLAALLAGTRIRIYHIRGLPYLTMSGAKRRLMQLTERIACAAAVRVLCVSHSVREVAIRDGLVSADRIVTLLAGSGNGVDAGGRWLPAVRMSLRSERRHSLGIPADARVVAFLGRLVRDKGVVELWRAWRELRTEFDDLHLVLAGPVEPRDPVPSTVLDDLSRDARVHMLGLVDDPMPVYALADVVAFPSHREGFPGVPLEAAALELPVVATRVPGCVDAVVDGVTGTLVRAGDAAGLAEALRRYLRDPATAAAHGRAGRARVLRDFVPQDIWEATRAEYVTLLSRQ